MRLEAATPFPSLQMEVKNMINAIKYGALAFAAIFMMVPEAQAQNYTQRGTRNGAIAGAIIGGIFGASRDRPLAGAAIGGLVGGVTGRAIGNAKDQRFYGGGHGHNGFGFQPHHGRQPVARPIYNGGFHGGGFHGGGFHGGGFGGYSPYGHSRYHGGW